MKNLIILVVVLLIIGGIFYLLGMNKAEAPESVTTFEQLNLEQENRNDDFAIDKSVGSNYSVTEGTVSYSADKQFFGKSSELVTGTTNFLSGDINIVSDSRVSAQLFVDSANFSTDSSKRDEDVSALLPQQIEIRVDDQNVDLSDGSYDGNLRAFLIVGNSSKETVLNVSIEMTDDGVLASGSGTVLISDLGIEPPSVLNVFTVGNSLNLAFEFFAE